MITASILALTLALPASPADAQTWAVRNAGNEDTGAVAPILADRSVGWTFCTATHCIVQTRTPEQRTALFELVDSGLVVLEELSDARRLFFQKATYDSDLASFDKSFPGQDEVDRTGPIGQFAVIFRSHPTGEWLKEIEQAGLIPVEPIPAMGYLVYGPREPLRKLAGVSSWMEAVVDIPAGLKRFRLDETAPGDDGEAISTSIAVVDVPDSFAMRLLDEATSGRSAQSMRMGVLLTYSARLTRAQAIVLSSLPEVVSVRRHTTRWEPADERSNRIVLGDWQTPGTSWLPPLRPLPEPQIPPIPPNALAAPFYQDQWLASFNALGLDVANQTIGILDTGIDRGKYDPGGQPICPPFLLTPSGECRLLFTTDVLRNFNVPSDRSLRADDNQYHGTIVASIAAGMASPTSPGRDYERYAFTQGTAPGAGVLFSKIFFRCGGDGVYPYYRTFFAAGGEGIFTHDDMEQKLRYSLVEMTNDGSSPVPSDRDESLPPPARAARIFNHSWHASANQPDIFNYEETAQMIDGTARDLAYAYFNFTSGTPSRGQQGAGALHVIAAGNYDWMLPVPENPQVQAPGTAKNALTVGATETYNPQVWPTDPCPSSAQAIATNPRRVAPFSRMGYPNFRLKPDLVAPGVRSYGRRSGASEPCTFSPQDCLTDVGSVPGEYAWSAGTSFATPVVSGAAALVREWATQRTTPPSIPSSALLRAILIAAARNLVPYRTAWGWCCESAWDCWACGDMRPTPDQQQGWGGVSLDKLFRSPSNYFFHDQATTFTANGQTWTKSLTISDPAQPIDVALVWTERPSQTTVWGAANLLNDLDVKITATGTGGVTRVWYGNYYYLDRNALGSARTGYSLPCSPNQKRAEYDRRNNVERINIEPASLPAGATSLTVTVTAFGLTTNGLDPLGSAALIQQDFALFAVNARE